MANQNELLEKKLELLQEQQKILENVGNNNIDDQRRNVLDLFLELGIGSVTKLAQYTNIRVRR